MITYNSITYNSNRQKIFDLLDSGLNTPFSTNRMWWIETNTMYDTVEQSLIPFSFICFTIRENLAFSENI